MKYLLSIFLLSTVMQCGYNTAYAKSCDKKSVSKYEKDLIYCADKYCDGSRPCLKSSSGYEKYRICSRNAGQIMEATAQRCRGEKEFYSPPSLDSGIAKGTPSPFDTSRRELEIVPPSKR